jgi:uncharacterized protein YaaN involved in tellurite resistance
MSEDTFQDDMQKAPAAPTLSFGAPVEEEKPKTVPTAFADAGKEAQELAAKAKKEAQLTPEEQKQVDAFVEKIDLSDSAGIISYGVSTQKNLADFSQKAIDNVRTSEMGEVGDMLAGLVTQLKNFDVDENEKGFLGFFKKKKNQLDEVKAKYAKIETNVDEVTTQLEQHQVKLLKDSEVLDRMYQLNLTYYKELTMYIEAGKKKLEIVRANDLVEAQQKAAASGLPEDAQAAKDLAAQCDRFEKKIYDLELTRTVSMQTAPQIRMIQNSDMQMAEKIQSTIVNTIPLWKNQMVIAIGMEHAGQAAKAEREVNDMTNELLKKNADKLHQVSVETAKENERGIVDIETLQHTNEQLILAMDDIMTIQKEGKEKRKEAEQQLDGIEQQLHDKLLEMSKN